MKEIYLKHKAKDKKGYLINCAWREICIWEKGREQQLKRKKDSRIVKGRKGNKRKKI
jgi:hypothetical protein